MNEDGGYVTDLALPTRGDLTMDDEDGAPVC